MRCLADFLLNSDMKFKDGEGPLTITAPDGDFEITLSNAPHATESPEAVLAARLIFDAESFENIRDIAMAKLSRALNCLTFATHRNFEYGALRQIIDWTPGIVDRTVIRYLEHAEWDTAEPELEDNFLQSAAYFLNLRPSNEQQSAMRWYRLAIRSSNAEEQFSYFWFALEIVAQLLKTPAKVPSKCSMCGGPLHCEACKCAPVHAPYPKQAIREIVERVHPKDADEVFRTLDFIRNTLMHGKRIESILHKLPCNQQQAINKLAFVTWHAIALTFPPPPENKPLHLGYVDNFVRRTMIFSATLITTLLPVGDPDNPSIEDFPNIEVDMHRVPRAESESEEEIRPVG